MKNQVNNILKSTEKPKYIQEILDTPNIKNSDKWLYMVREGLKGSMYDYKIELPRVDPLNSNDTFWQAKEKIDTIEQVKSIIVGIGADLNNLLHFLEMYSGQLEDRAIEKIEFFRDWLSKALAPRQDNEFIFDGCGRLIYPMVEKIISRRHAHNYTLFTKISGDRSKKENKSKRLEY